MPRVNVPVTLVTRDGVVEASEVSGDAVNNHEVINDGATWLEVRNSSGTTGRTVTFRIQATVDGQAVTSRATLLALSTTRKFGPFPTGMYGSLLQVDVDHADLKLTAYRLAS